MKLFIPHLEEDENEDDDDGETQSRTTKKKSDYKPFLPKIQMVPHLFLWLVVVVDLHRLHCLPRAWILSPWRTSWMGTSNGCCPFTWRVAIDFGPDWQSTGLCLCDDFLGDPFFDEHSIEVEVNMVLKELMDNNLPLTISTWRRTRLGMMRMIPGLHGGWCPWGGREHGGTTAVLYLLPNNQLMRMRPCRPALRNVHGLRLNEPLKLIYALSIFFRISKQVRHRDWQRNEDMMPSRRVRCRWSVLSTANNALQVYNQLREQLEESFCRLIWISGGCNLSDALTKKARVAREGLIQLFKQNIREAKVWPNLHAELEECTTDGQSCCQSKCKSCRLWFRLAMIQQGILDWCDWRTSHWIMPLFTVSFQASQR